MARFKDKVHAKLAAYCDEVKGAQEQMRRRDLLSSETKKVVESQEWEAALQAFEDKVTNWVQKNVIY